MESEISGSKGVAQRQARTAAMDLRGSFEAPGVVEERLNSLHGSRVPLPGEVRSFMEPRSGTDFSGVHIHSGSEAADLNRQINAQSFTHGQDIFLGQGSSNPSSEVGKHLLAHELAHVVQQSGGLRRSTGRRIASVQRLGNTEIAMPGYFKTIKPGVKFINWQFEKSTTL
jgi:hypothetical protein